MRAPPSRSDFRRRGTTTAGKGRLPGNGERDRSEKWRLCARIADRHGARRYAQGWDEAAVRRDQEILREEVERAVLGRTSGASAEADAALTVLLRLIDRAEAISVAAWRRAAAAPNAGR